jgi:thioredoxin-related protein
VKKTKGLFPEKYLWKGEVFSGTVNHAHISGYAGLRRPTRERLKVNRDEKTALSLFLRRKECWKTTILCKFLCLLTFTLIVFVPYKFWLGIVYEIVVINRGEIMRRNLTIYILISIVMLSCTRVEVLGWETDFKKALATAKASGKYIMLDFSGSDWCGWCKKLEKEVFSQDAFKDFAEKNLVCLLVDFPRKKKQTRGLKQRNRDLATKYGIQGYPTIIILSPDGEPVGKTGYLQGGSRKYVQHLNEIIERHNQTRKD